MSTWHQDKAGPVKLGHPTEWTVVSDPPNELRTAISFISESLARAYVAKFEHCYLIPPTGVSNGN